MITNLIKKPRVRMVVAALLLAPLVPSSSFAADLKTVELGSI
jgi:hypothetical protein